MSLLRTLQAGTGEQMLAGGPGLAVLAKDAQVTATLVHGLAADTPAVRAMAARLLGRLGDQGSVPALASRLDDGDGGVRAAAIDALAALAYQSSLPEPVRQALVRFDDPETLVRRASVRAVGVIEPEVIVAAAPELSKDPAPEVRSELAVALIRADEEDRPHALLVALLEADDPAARLAGLDAVGRLGGHAPSKRIPDYLADPSPRVRAGAVRALAAVDGSEDLEAPFVAALDDDALAVRQAAAAVLRERSRPANGLLEVLDHGSGPAQEAALAALQGHVEAVREPLVAWSDRQVSRATTLRRQRLALEPPPGAAPPQQDEGLAFLASVLARREASIETRLLTALGLLGVPEASGLIRRCLRSNDADTRAQAIEALDSLGDGRLRRGVVGLLEDQPPISIGDRSAVIMELAGDSDGWIRALALRARAELIAAEWASMAARAATDPEPQVRAAIQPLIAQGGPVMPQVSQLVGDVDRMLFLRRVPLFRELDPEDLQRVAASATENLYAAGEALVRQGDIGAELVIIVEGTVRVVREEPDGKSRDLRTYGPGDHIGELALLREQPRAATVIAEEPGVRGLVINGNGLMAILRERPDAAMAMLATLAERISAQ
jgi:HEAT repeat protein